MSRVDALLSELQSRHRNDDPQFLAAIRPAIERILDDATPEHARVALLEMLAETFERDRRNRENIAAARDGIARFFAELRRRLEQG
ncbi:MAG: hypothetical protein U1E73_01445 [Planctomycetota bacterium]